MLVFDFDGVLIDSVREVAVTGYNAVTGEAARSLEDLPPDLFPLFRRNRPVIRSAPELFTLMRWCVDRYETEPEARLTRDGFQSLLDEDDLSEEERASRFFKTRERFVSADREAWMTLNAPFQPLWDRLKERGGEGPVILTNKNQSAVMEICRHFGLAASPDNIHGGDDNRPKTERMAAIDDRFGDRPYTFIDDALGNLVEMDRHFNGKENLIRPVLARWGYLGPGDVDEARRFGYDVFDQDDLMAIL